MDMRSDAPDPAVASEAPDATTGDAALAVGTLSDWKDLLKGEELRCAEHGFGAGILSIGVENAREDEDARIYTAIAPHLTSTDRVCVLRHGEVGVLVIPIDGVHELEERAQVAYDALRQAGVPASVGFALRRDGHGLFHAAAQADAAMLRRRPGGIDLR